MQMAESKIETFFSFGCLQGEILEKARGNERLRQPLEDNTYYHHEATGCMPSIFVFPSSIFPDAMQRADTGMINIPTVMEVSAVRFRIICVTRLTVSTTTSGFTLAYQEGEAPSPASRSTYLGIVHTAGAEPSKSL